MKIIKIIKTFFQHNRQQVPDDVSSNERQIFNFWVWMSVAFVLCMLSVTNIFEVQFLVFDPANFKPQATGIKVDFCNNATFKDILPQIDQNVSSEVSSTTTVKPSTTTVPSPLMNKILKNDLEEGSSVHKIKFYFFCGMPVGCFLLGPMVSMLGKAGTFKLLARSITIFGFFMSICVNSHVLGVCWFVIGACSITIYHLTYTRLHEKYSDLHEGALDNPNETRAARYTRYKSRLYLGLGFTIMYNCGRMFSILIAWVTKDWTLICMWLSLLFLFIYYLFGDFFTNQFKERQNEQQSKELKSRETGDDNFWSYLRAHPILILNLGVLCLNWFVCCLNLYVLMSGWARISSFGDMFMNLVVASSFSTISIPLRFGICMASKRKLLPYCILQIFCGISILVMIALSSEKICLSPTTTSLTNPRTFAAHVANVLISAVLGVLEVFTVETFPEKYRMHCVGISAGFGRIGSLVGTIISTTTYLTADYGPAISGTLAIIAAVVSRILPDMTTSRLPRLQSEIEREQFPHKFTSSTENLQVQEVA